MAANVLQLRGLERAAQVFILNIEHAVGIVQRTLDHLFLAQALLGRQVHGHAAHGALTQHPHGGIGIPGRSVLLELFMLGQNVLERPGQNLLQLLHLGLHGFELRFTLQRGSGFFGLCSGSSGSGTLPSGLSWAMVRSDNMDITLSNNSKKKAATLPTKPMSSQHPGNATRCARLHFTA